MSGSGAQPATWPSIAGGRLPVRRILVVQTQRLGDVLCATPVFAALRRQFPAAHLAALVHRPMDELLAESPDLDEVLTYDRQSTHRGLGSRFRLVRELRAREFDWVLSIHAASSVAFALVAARIPWRTCVWRYGDYRKPHWRQFFQQHVRQDRRRGEKHEIEYNLDVLRQLGMEPADHTYRVYLAEHERRWAREWLKSRGRDERRPLAIVHPGHGGGRQSWAPAQFAATADGLVRRGYQVGITGGPKEVELVGAIAGQMREPALELAGGTTIRELAAVLAQARLFVSVSTGPMHLASAVGAPAVTLYGPTDLRIEKTRFCPYGSQARAVVSPVACTCPSSKSCREPVCMLGLTPEMALSAADELSAVAAG
ncbi:MAG: glycosyltransferase family 9 protein [Armatimonadota bacterium]